MGDFCAIACHLSGYKISRPAISVRKNINTSAPVFPQLCDFRTKRRLKVPAPEKFDAFYPFKGNGRSVHSGLGGRLPG